MFRFLVSGVFLLVPIGATIGILMGITSFRRANGQDPPFSGDPGDGLPGIVPKGKDMVLFACDEATGLHPQTNGEEFTMNPNPWGWTKGTPGHICMSVNQFANKSYGDDKTAAPWNITWQYPPASGDLPVHAYANALVESKSLPAKLGDIKTFDFDVEWYLSMKNDTLVDASDADLTQNSVNANVAIDMFLDPDQTLSMNQNEKTPAHYEVMVWFADIGPAAFPLGKTKAADEGVVTTATIGGYEFQLFAQKNEKSQQVLSWVSTEHAYKFNASISDFMNAIYKQKNPDYPSSTDYLGYVAFGQEAYSATNNVTFSVPRLRVDIST